MTDELRQLPDITSGDRFFELSPDALCIIGPDGTLTRVNRAFAELLGLPPEELSGTPFIDLIHQDDRPATSALLACLSPDGRGASIENCVERGDGSFVTVSWSLQCAPDAPVVHAAGRKVSARMQQQGAGGRQPRFFESILYNLDDIVYAWNRENQFIYGNRRLEEIWGLTQEEFLGKTPAELGYPVELQELFAQQIEEVFETRTAVSREIPYTSPSGEFGYYEYTFSPVFADDDQVAFVGGVSRNTTRRREAEDALRESERRLRLATEAARMFSWEIDLKSHTFRWSENASAVVGQPMPRDLDTALAMIHPDDRDAVGSAVRQAIEQQGDLSVEFRVAGTPRHQQQWRYLTGTTVVSSDGSPSRMLGITQDITDRKRRELNTEVLASIASDFTLLGAHDEIVRVVSEKIQAHFGASRFNVFRIQETAGEVTTIYDRHDPGLEGLPATCDLSDAVSQDMLEEMKSRQIVVIDDVRTDPRTTSVLDTYSALQVGSLLLVCHTTDGLVDFAVAIQHAEPYAWRPDEIELIRELGVRLYLRLERARVESAFRESQDRYRTLFESIDQGYLLCDVLFDDEGQPVDILYTEANPAAIRMIGQDPVGKRLTEIDPHFEPYWYEIWGEVVRTGEAKRMERYAEPIQTWLNFYIFKPDADNVDSHRVAVVFQDVTKRKNAEMALRESEARQAFLLSLSDRLRGLSEPQDIMFAASEAIGTYLDVSQVGYCEVDDDQDSVEAGGEFSDGRMPSFAGYRFRLSAYGPGYGPALRAGEDIYFDDMATDPRAIPSGSDEMRAMRVRAGAAVPLVKHGRLVGYLYALSPERRAWPEAERVLLREVAERTWAAVERARAEKERERQRRVAEDAVRARDEFLSIASHELRNPLATIRASSQLLNRWFEQGRLDEDRGQRVTSALEDATGRLSVLVDDLLDVSRLQSGQLRMNRQPVNLAELIQAVVDEQGVAARGRPFRVDLEDSHTSQLDAERIRQVLVNLLDNAVKYSPDNSEIQVTLRYDDEGALLQVRDQGIGLPEGTAESIFTLFGRAHNAAASNIPGMGLGLYICRRIAEAHGGRLWAESLGEGQGTTVNLRLPTHEEDDLERPTASTGS